MGLVLRREDCSQAAAGLVLCSTAIPFGGGRSGPPPLSSSGSGVLREQPSALSVERRTEPEEGPRAPCSSGPRDPDFIPSGSKQGTSGRERAGRGQQLWSGPGDGRGGRCEVPFPQHEVPKGLGWRDDGSILRWAHSLGSGRSHTTTAISM